MSIHKPQPRSQAPQALKNLLVPAATAACVGGLRELSGGYPATHMRLAGRRLAGRRLAAHARAL